MQGNRTKLTLLHSNDIHGDFMPSEKDNFFSGGISLLSGYVSKVRAEEENVIYAVAGDLFMGSVVDKEYRGLSTIKLFNALQPDIFEVGNHEVDYGLSHLLFLEKCAAFPILCANLYIKELNRRLFMPYFDIERGGIRVRFIGVLTESVSEKISQEELIETEVGVRDVYKEIDKVFAATDWDRADITILLTHIGIEEDKKLAEFIKPEWGVDFIIGAHSHTFMEEPLVVNGITIAQAGVGSSQIGRFDIVFDSDERRIESFEWKLVAPVEEKEGVIPGSAVRTGDIIPIVKEGRKGRGIAELCKPDGLIDFYLGRMKGKTDSKYDQVLFTLDQEYEHGGFHRETQLIDLFSDIYNDAFGTDVFFLSTNIIRCKLLGKTVKRKDFELAYPYDNEVYIIKLKGDRLKEVFSHIYRKEAWFGTMIFFLFSGSMRVDYDKEEYEVRQVYHKGRPLEADREYKVGITSYAYKNCGIFLGLELEGRDRDIKVKQISAGDREVLEKYFESHEFLTLENEGRLNIMMPGSKGNNAFMLA